MLAIIHYTNLSSTVLLGKHDNRSHNDEICVIDFSSDIVLNFSFKFKYSKKIKLSCIALEIDPSTFKSSNKQLSKYFKVFCPSTIRKTNFN